MNNYNDMFGGIFGDIFGNTSDNPPKQNNYQSSLDYDRERLDELWQEYDELVNELKNDGYKVLRNSQGVHKIVKNERES